MPAPLLAGLGPTELIIILIVVIVLFGASKLPDLARNSGQALRIFKAETKGLMDGDADARDAKGAQVAQGAQGANDRTPEQLEIDRRAQLDRERAEFEAEKARYEQDRRSEGA